METGGGISTGDKKTYSDLSELVNEYDWCYNAGTTTLYCYAATDPDTRYTSVESSERYGCIRMDADPNKRACITIDGLELLFARDGGIVQYIVSTTPEITVPNCTLHSMWVQDEWRLHNHSE